MRENWLKLLISRAGHHPIDSAQKPRALPSDAQQAARRYRTVKFE
jgi:hypothetical protein